MSRAYALSDGNSFYCSCERVFDASLKTKPVIVLSINDGCAVARTSEAKALGIGMGEPYFKIKDLCRRGGVKVSMQARLSLVDGRHDTSVIDAPRHELSIAKNSLDLSLLIRCASCGMWSAGAASSLEMKLAALRPASMKAAADEYFIRASPCEITTAWCANCQP